MTITNLKQELCDEWHPTKNQDKKPEHFKPFSNIKVWWRCKKGHEWQARINERSRGSVCPYCCGRLPSPEYCLLSIRPDIASQWHPSLNDVLTAKDVTPNSSKKVWWICIHGHEWLSTVSHRTSGRNCPYCSNKKVGKNNNLGVINPELAEEWHPYKNGELTPFDVTPGSNKKVWWRCKK